MPAPNLLQIVPTLERGSLARATLDTAQAVIAAGGRAVVASPGGAMVADLLRARATHLELPTEESPLWGRLTLPRKLAASLRTSDIDIVQGHSLTTAWIAGAVARRLGAKWIATLHPPLEPHGLAEHLAVRDLARADAVIAVSEHVARSARPRLGTNEARLAVIPPGVNFERFDPLIVRADRVIKLAHELRLPDGAPVVLFPTRFDRDRGHKRLIAAIKLLKRDDIFCLLLGSTGTPTPFEKEIEKEIANANLLGHVQIGPYVDDMPAAYMLADVAVALGGEQHGFSRTLAEAQAMGRPVVAEAGGGTAEELRAGVTGWLAAPNDPASLAEALSAALALSTAGRAELARAAQELARNRFDLSSTNRQLLALYERLAG